MKPFSAILTVLSVITLVVTVVLAKTNTQSFQNQIAQAPDSPEVLSETAPPTETLTPSPTPIVTPKPTVVATAKPSSQPVGFDISVFVYPGGKVIERSSTHLAIESTDSPNNITPWYKEKIQAYKFSAKSFASTNTNGNYLTKMAAAGSDGELTVEIKKAAPDTITLIEVDLSK